MFTFSAVSHAPLRWLQVVDEELAAVSHCDGDAEEAAVLGAAVEELPGGTSEELADLAGPWQGGVLQGQPHRSLRTTAIHLHEGKQSLPAARGLLYPSPGLKVVVKPTCSRSCFFTGRECCFLTKNLDNQEIRGETQERQETLQWCQHELTSTQEVGISAGLLLILNLYQPADSEWSQIRSWMAVFWISEESKSTLRYGLRKVRWPPG